MLHHTSSNTDGDHIEQVALDDRQRGDSTAANVLKTSDGHVAYPEYIPPAVDAPKPPATSSPSSTETDDKAYKSSDPRPARSVSLTQPPKRPAHPRKSNTELAGPPRANFPLRRAGTSYLDKAICEGCQDGFGLSSSSEDEDGGLSRENQAGQESKGLKTKLSRNKDKTNGKTNTGDRHGQFRVGNENYETMGKMKKDGRLRITVNETANTGYIAKALGGAMRKVAPAAENKAASLSGSESDATSDPAFKPSLNIVIMVIGSRGDAQPFLKIGKTLKEDYGHRVRIATHPAFREFVEKDSGLEFFSVGGDPSELMAFMNKNPGMVPSLETVKAGDIGKRRAAMAGMFEGFWRACIDATDDEHDRQNLKMMGDKDPFVADAIIANPPSFAHIHCAEALGIPLHLMFTFPYTPTQAFPHPLASIKKSNVDPGYTNFISYPLVDMMVWQGLGDLVNDFRVKTLALDPVSTLWAPGATYRLHVPFTYLWSPSLVPKPSDWGPEVDVSGFVFLDLASSFQPPKELEDFLNAGEPPIYIGFGSIVVDDADRFTKMIFEAVEMAGVRALVSKGWGGLGGDDVPDDVFMLENTPHDWLFPRVQACVIHGGAGTTAIALKCGRPTMVVPFFGDQHFWGSMIGNSGAGPEPVPYKHLDAEKLADGIKFCQTDEAQRAAQKIAVDIGKEGDGAANAVKKFHSHLGTRGLKQVRCSLLHNKVAVWKPKNSHARLSPEAADILVSRGDITWKRLRLLRHTEWNDFEGPGEPVTGIAESIGTTLGNTFTGIGGVPYRLAKTNKKRKEKRAEKEERRAQKAADKQQTDSRTGINMAANRAPPEPGQNGNADPSDVASIKTSTTANGGAEYMGDVADGFEQSATAIAKAPADLSLALAQGFHNAPRLYGDDTVRRPTRVTGFRSGLVAARKEFVYGLYDGVTGVVRHPVRGAKNDGVVGFIKGTGMGVTGLVLKTSSAIVGPFGYTLRGIVKQAERSKRPQKIVRRARIAQGHRKMQAMSAEERQELENTVVEGGRIMKELSETISDKQRQRGLTGQIDRMLLDTSYMFRDVETAKEALEALRSGKSLEQAVEQHREGRKGQGNGHGTGNGRRS